ncbi:MAG: hypothetical protein VW881_08520, partial [Alphaproteobacteria bacterium]
MEYLNELWTPFADFWSLTHDVLDNTAFGTSFGRILLAVFVFALLLIARGLFARFVIGWLKRVARRTDSKLDDSMIQAIDHPMRFVPALIGFFLVLQILQLQGTFETIGLRLIRSLIVFTMFWGAIALVEPVSMFLSKLREILSATMLDWTIKSIKILLGVIGAAAILQLWG